MGQFSDLSDFLKTKTASQPVPLDDNGFPSEPCRIFSAGDFNWEGKEGISIEVYPPLLFVILYQSFSDTEIETLGSQLLSVFPGKQVLIQDRSIRPFCWRWESENIPEEMIVSENGLRFIVHPKRGQNAGFFPDMRGVRKLIGNIVSEGKASGIDDFRVLNLFAYTCSLSVAAITGGADSCINIDMNGRSLAIGRRNHQLNFREAEKKINGRVSYLPHNIYKSFGKLKKAGLYQLIIADPPPTQRGSFILEKDYPRLLRRLTEMLASGGTVILTLNSAAFTREEFEAMVKRETGITGCWEAVNPPEDYSSDESGKGLKILIGKAE